MSASDVVSDADRPAVEADLDQALAPSPVPGGRTWTFKTAQTVIINRPSADVFAYRSELTNSPEWRRGVLSCNLETEGPIWIGTRAAETRSAGPDAPPEGWAFEVFDFEPGARLGIRASRGPTQLTELHEFSAQGGFTRYTVSVEVVGGSASASAFQKQLLENLLQLKWALEGVAVHPWVPPGQRPLAS